MHRGAHCTFCCGFSSRNSILNPLLPTEIERQVANAKPGTGEGASDEEVGGRGHQNGRTRATSRLLLGCCRRRPTTLMRAGDRVSGSKSDAGAARSNDSVKHPNQRASQFDAVGRLNRGRERCRILGPLTLPRIEREQEKMAARRHNYRQILTTNDADRPIK